MIKVTIELPAEGAAKLLLDVDATIAALKAAGIPVERIELVEPEEESDG